MLIKYNKDLVNPILFKLMFSVGGILISSVTFYLFWNIAGQAILKLQPIGLLEVMAVNALCLPVEILFMISMSATLMGRPKSRVKNKPRG